MDSTISSTANADADYLGLPNNKRLSHIPGEWGLPLFGKTFALEKDPVGMLNKHVEKYGQLARISLGLEKGILVTHPDHLQEVFIDKQQNFSSTMGYNNQIETFYGGSVITLDFARHKISRRVLQEAFKSSALRGYVDIMNPTIKANIECWDKIDDFRFVPRVRQVLIDIAARMFFGIKDDEGVHVQTLVQAFKKISERGLEALVKWDIPGFKYHTGLQGKRELEAFILGIIPERRRNPGTDLTSLVAQEVDDNGELWSGDVLVHHLSFMLFAAHDTTSGATSHLMMHLAKPENHWLQERLREQAFGLNKEMPSFEDLESYEEYERCVFEALRLHPSATFVFRRTIRQCTLGDRVIPARTKLFNLPHWAQYCPDYWTEPFKFDPERFSPERKEHKAHPYAFVPFGGGAHKCIGMHIAMMNTKLILHHILRKFRFELQAGYDCRCQTIPIPFPSKSLPLKVTRL